MTSKDKRASLSSALLAVKKPSSLALDLSAPLPQEDADEPIELAVAGLAQPLKPEPARAEPQTAEIVQLKPLEAKSEAKPAAKPVANSETKSEAMPALRRKDFESLLYGKGSASPEGFRPKNDNNVVTLPPPPPRPMPKDKLSRRIAHVSILGFGLIALYFSTNLFVLSRVTYEKAIAMISSPDAMAHAAPAPVAGEAVTLMVRGDEFFTMGDIASARLYYERAADAGSAEAALRAGETFDPAFLGRNRLLGMRAEPEQAERWYRRARELGSRTAEALLAALKTK